MGIQAKPNEKFADMIGQWELCEKCRGEGEYRDDYRYKLHCGRCNGWGWVKEGQNHEHDWEASKYIAWGCNGQPSCYELTCKICGQIRLIDSSD
jgi:DnaJ-class molecular chaperone